MAPAVVTSAVVTAAVPAGMPTTTTVMAGATSTAPTMVLRARLIDAHRHCHGERRDDRDYESFHGNLLIRSISIGEDTLHPALAGR
jgi:hypothetical protein